jgi:outer membrane cobalamin receptor
VGYQRAQAHFFDSHPPFGSAFDDRSDVHELNARAEWNRAVGALRIHGGVDARQRQIDATSLPAGAPRTLNDAGAWTRLEYRPAWGGKSFWLSGELRLDHDALVNGLVLSPKVAIGKTLAGVVGEITLGNAFSPPGLSDLFFQEGVLVRSNPALAPERVRQELTASLSRTFAVQSATAAVFATAYRADVTGMILWFPDFRFVWSPNNFDVRRRGVDVGGDVRSARSVVHLAARGSLAQVTYAGSTLSGQVVYRPAATGHAEAGLRLGSVLVSASGEYVGRRRTVAGSPLNTLDPYTLAGAGVSFDRRVGAVTARIQLSVQNLFNQAAAMLADFPLPGRSLSLRVDFHTSRWIHGGDGDAR